MYSTRKRSQKTMEQKVYFHVPKCTSKPRFRLGFKKQLFGPLSPKFKRVSLNETPEFHIWGFNICVDFYLRNSKKN